MSAYGVAGYAFGPFSGCCMVLQVTLATGGVSLLITGFDTQRQATQGPGSGGAPIKLRQTNGTFLKGGLLRGK